MPAMNRDVLERFADVKARNNAYIQKKYENPHMRASRCQYDFGSGGVHVEEVRGILPGKDLSHVKGM